MPSFSANSSITVSEPIAALVEPGARYAAVLGLVDEHIESIDLEVLHIVRRNGGHAASSLLERQEKPQLRTPSKSGQR